MKRSFKANIQSIVLILLLIVLIQSTLLLLAVNEGVSVRKNIQSIVITFFFIIFSSLIFTFYFLPHKVHQALKELQSLIAEISDGNFDKDIDGSLYDADLEIQRIVVSIRKLLSVSRRFDQLKTGKIYEQNQRIQQMINLIPQGIMIFNLSGDLAYCNDVMRRKLIWIQEGININEVMLKNSFERCIFEIIIDSLRHGNNVYDNDVNDSNGNRVVSINGSIIRDRNGLPSGGVYVLDMSNDVAAH
ncbi:MAG: hypothetical protein FJ042_02350 [Candidatus Cloacimonetes bacterium]|nr:hypothetical protein [Candidatus Cloacimonadota bacterium]